MQKIDFLKCDENNRTVSLYHLSNACLNSSSESYPDISFRDLCQTHYPISDRVLSLNVAKNLCTNIIYEVKRVESTPAFFFIYNTENYYHFIYDTLPYLISYFEIKKSVPNLKLLMSYPLYKNFHYKFVLEFLELFYIYESDILLIDKHTEYSSLYYSDSFTHGHNSNLPPRKEIYQLYKQIVDIVRSRTLPSNKPDKIYISRRTWLHNQLDNIGTNYTNRRKLVNETDLVDYLKSLGYTEVFTELMTTAEKISLFYSAKNVIGSIGGGIANVLFSKKECNTTAIISPGFLDVNYRFLHSLNQTNLTLFNQTSHINNNEYKLYMRVKCGDIIGEIVHIFENELKIKYAKDTIVGWSDNVEYEEITVKKCDCTKLDSGLNSPWKIDLEEFKKVIHD